MASRDARIVPVAHLEGMASLGLIREYWVEDCGYEQARRIHAVTKDGEHLVTKCIDMRGAKKVELYLALARQASSDLVEEFSGEAGEEKYIEDGGES